MPDIISKPGCKIIINVGHHRLRYDTIDVDWSHKMIRTIISNHVFDFASSKNNKHPTVVHPLSQRYIGLQHSAVKKEHAMGVHFPVIVGFSNHESSMLLGCYDYVRSPSFLVDKMGTEHNHDTQGAWMIHGSKNQR